MRYIQSRGLDMIIKSLTQPVLGICLGLQLMCTASEENDTICLGIFDQNVKRFPSGEKVPHMGWNLLESFSGPLFKGLPSSPYVYFVHSYYAELGLDTCAESEYMIRFSASLYRNNFMAVQFHPEKSGLVGEKILDNFLRL